MNLSMRIPLIKCYSHEVEERLTTGQTRPCVYHPHQQSQQHQPPTCAGSAACWWLQRKRLNNTTNAIRWTLTSSWGKASIGQHSQCGGGNSVERQRAPQLGQAIKGEALRLREFPLLHDIFE